MIYVLALALGSVSVIEVPTRQSFVVEMVGEDQLSNAVGLNSTVFTSARVIGPAMAGMLIAGVGIVVFPHQRRVVRRRDPEHAEDGPAELFTDASRSSEPKGQLREGLRYVWRTPDPAIVALDDGHHRHDRVQLPHPASRHG